MSPTEENIKIRTEHELDMISEYTYEINELLESIREGVEKMKQMKAKEVKT